MSETIREIIGNTTTTPIAVGKVAALDEIGKESLSAEVQETLDKIKNQPSKIDMTAFESEGKIVETYPDETTKTTIMEFDDEGNPIKITDPDGNETELVWPAE